MGKRLTTKIFPLIIVFVIIGVGIYYGLKTAHQTGYDAGVAATENRIDNLSNAVVAKNQVINTISQIKAPSTVTNKNVDAYLKDLQTAETTLRDNNETAVADLLADYIASWKDFKVYYASKDNQLIEKEYDKIKTAYEDFLKKSKDNLDQRIIEAAK